MKTQAELRVFFEKLINRHWVDGCDLVAAMEGVTKTASSHQMVVAVLLLEWALRKNMPPDVCLVWEQFRERLQAGVGFAVDAVATPEGEVGGYVELDLLRQKPPAWAMGDAS